MTEITELYLALMKSNYSTFYNLLFFTPNTQIVSEYYMNRMLKLKKAQK